MAISGTYAHLNLSSCLCAYFLICADSAWLTTSCQFVTLQVALTSHTRSFVIQRRMHAIQHRLSCIVANALSHTTSKATRDTMSRKKSASSPLFLHRTISADRANPTHPVAHPTRIHFEPALPAIVRSRRLRFSLRLCGQDLRGFDTLR